VTGRNVAREIIGLVMLFTGVVSLFVSIIWLLIVDRPETALGLIGLAVIGLGWKLVRYDADAAAADRVDAKITALADLRRAE
jgi:uncharacterized membrane protein